MIMIITITNIMIIIRNYDAFYNQREKEEKYQDLEELDLPQLCKSMHFRFEKGP